MLSVWQLQITRNEVRPRIDHQVFGAIGQVPNMGELKLILPP